MHIAPRAGVATPALALHFSMTCALALAPGAAAAYTSAEAWQAWQETAAANEIALGAGTETAGAGRLVVADVTFATLTDEDARIAGTIAEITFVETGPGTVAVTLPPEIPFTVSGVTDAGADYAAQMRAALPGVEITMASTGSDGSVLTTAAPEIRVTLEGVTVDGEDADVALTATLSGVASENVTGTGDLPAVSSRFAADAATLAVSGTDPEDGGRFEIRLAAADLASRTDGTGSALLTMAGDIEDAVARGFTAAGEGSVGALDFAVATRDTPGSGALEGSLGGARATAAIDAARVDYQIATEDLALALTGGDLPMARATASLGAWESRIALPVQDGAAAGPLALTLALRDLVLGEEVWSLIDPAGILPRDPATLVVDLAGRARATGAVLGAEMEDPGEVPIEVDRLDVTDLRLAVAGALLTGTGGFDFDWSAPGPFGPGSPVPDGALSLRLTGGEGLLQGLIRMGLIGEEEAMMARMMTGLLARPGPGPDELVSEITVLPDGRVLANGAPLPF